MKTIELKIFKPSLYKKEIIDGALENYSRAYDYLMENAIKEIEFIKENHKDSTGKYTLLGISKWVGKSILKELNTFNIEPFKDSLKLDFSSALASCLNNSSNISTEIYAANKKKFRPIYFCRYSKNRNYSLLYDEKNNKYYAKLYLMNVRNKSRKASVADCNKQLQYISLHKEVYKESSNKRSFIIVPLAFGRWQEQYLSKAILKPEILKTARLIRRDNEYYLAINIVRSVEEGEEPINYLGISRGMEKAIFYTIVDKEGDILIQNSEVSAGHISDDKLHVIANNLVKTAKEYNSEVIVEKLTEKGDSLTFTDKQGRCYLPQMNCSLYNKLANIIRYKLIEEGMKPPVSVSAAGVFNTCSSCGRRSKTNRFSDKLLICTSCGRTMEVDKSGSLNLARKLIKYNNEKVPIFIKNTSNGVFFCNEDLDLKYHPSNPFDFYEEFMKEIDQTVKKFYLHLKLEQQKENFKKKYSLIKKLEADRKNFKLIEKEL